MTRLCVIGIGADGWDGLPEPVRERVRTADVVVGGERHLGLLPPVPRQRRHAWPSPLRGRLRSFLEDVAHGDVVVLASGDPLLSGIGTTLVRLYGEASVAVVPAVSSVTLARARMRWSAEETEVVTLVGRDPHLVLRALAPGRRILVLSSDESTPTAVASLLVEAGYADSVLTVLGDLGTGAESRTQDTAAAWGDRTVPGLHVLAVECAQPSVPPLAVVGGLPDEAFEHDGQLTKRDLRASAIARLVPLPGALLWDVGAGAGSVGIEWMRVHPSAQAVAVERDPGRAERIRRNAARLGVPGLEVVEGRAPDALAGLPRPDAVFVGGGATGEGVLDACWDALGDGGRLVVHGVTLETESVLARWYDERGGELARLQVEHAAPIGGFTGWTPSRAVVQWAVTKSGGAA
ncbi:precorrin-6y C5,15-methyltransferase (decarboxylating) subunit CbiE [Mumia sp. DW29H23]|uniref:precorrin-6y C5,15-methyltransferase (decarboxylating) subunit CbiE n=1 Tax=Mumia sp. DW29H23 TaxID=3421241 RepID=UPI003D68C7A5